MSGGRNVKTIILTLLISCNIFCEVPLVEDVTNLLSASDSVTQFIFSSSSTNKNVFVATGIIAVRGVQVDATAAGGAIKIWDSAGSTTSFVIEGGTISFFDASTTGSLGYHGPWSVWTSSGLTFNQEGDIRFRLDYEIIRIR